MLNAKQGDSMKSGAWARRRPGAEHRTPVTAGSGEGPPPKGAAPVHRSVRLTGRTRLAGLGAAVAVAVGALAGAAATTGTAQAAAHIVAAGYGSRNGSASADAASTSPFGDSKLVSMFDGKTLSGWTTADSKGWVVKNSAIHSTGDARGWIYYNKKQAGNFRWIFDVRQEALVGTPHMPTVLIWGTLDPIRDALSAIQFQPPSPYGWDYRPGENNDGNGKFHEVTNLHLTITKWSQCEIVADRDTGVAKMACCPLATGATTCTDAKETVVFTDKTAGRVGPIALQVHNAGIQDEFKGLYLESPVTYKPGEFITS
jgi:hypothetical protein